MCRIGQLVLVVLMMAGVTGVVAKDKPAEPWVHIYEDLKIGSTPYRLLRPIKFDAEQTYPVIVSLHSGGGKGTDNISNLRQYNRHLTGEKVRQDYPCYVVAPQASTAFDEKMLATIKEIIKGLPSVDMDRIYVLGHSMGGAGSYRLLQMDSAYFAAAAPAAASGLKNRPTKVDVELIKDVPIWVFHGDVDKVCPYSGARVLFEKMKAVGANYKLTTWAGYHHNTGNKLIGYQGNDKAATTEYASERCDKEATFMKWLFSKKASSRVGNSKSGE